MILPKRNKTCQPGTRIRQSLASLVIAMIGIGLLPTPVLANANTTVKADAKPSAVTVYSDRAQVTRSMVKALQPGKHTILFDNLPGNIDQSSIQVKISDNAVIQDVKLKQVNFSVIPDADIKQLKQKIQSVQDKITDINDKITQAKNEKEFIVKISNKLTATQEKNAKTPLDPKKWISMVEFYRGKLVKADQEIRSAEREKRVLDSQLEKLENDLGAMGSRQNKTKRQVHLTVNIQSASPTGVKLSYIVYGPSWRPIYDLRVNSKKRDMKVVYNAIVKQNTGENWNNVKLKLSTAQPQINGESPKLSPWYLALNSHFPVGGIARNESGVKLDREYSKYKERLAAKSGSKYPAPAKKPTSKTEPVFGKSRSQIMRAAIQSQATSSVFVVDDRYSIKTDNNQHKVLIMHKTLKTKFRYDAIPKLSLNAYLKAKVKNTTDFAFLPGQTNVFLDNSFVTQSSMKMVSPQQEFWTDLGIDGGIKITYKYINKVKETAGVFSKSKRFTYEFLMTVQNNKKDKIDIQVWDQLPLSRDKDIKIDLIKPVVDSDSKLVKINKEKYIRWQYKAVPGKKISIPLKFSVEHPENKSLAYSEPHYRKLR